MKKELILICIFAMLLSGCVVETNTPPSGTEDFSVAPVVNPLQEPVPEPEPQAEPAPEPELQGELSVEKQFHFVNGLGYYHITGILKNTGSVPLKNARAKVTVYTADGVEEIRGDVVPGPTRLAPGEIAGFDVTVGEADEYDVGNFIAESGGFSIDDSESYSGLEVSGCVADIEGAYYKLGCNVKNTGGRHAPMYWVAALFYDSSGNVLSTGSKVIVKDGAGLKAGDSMQISFITYDPSSALHIEGHYVAINFKE